MRMNFVLLHDSFSTLTGIVMMMVGLCHILDKILFISDDLLNSKARANGLVDAKLVYRVVIFLCYRLFFPMTLSLNWTLLIFS